MLGKGGGFFFRRTAFGTGADPTSIAIGDVNGDGYANLAVGNNDGGTVSVLEGDGLGWFAAKTDFAAGPGASSVALADLNGDARLDLAVTNRDAPRFPSCWATATGALRPSSISIPALRRTRWRSRT